MDLKKLTEAIDAQVLAGDIAGAFEAFAADNCITHSNPQDITRSKAQKTEALRWFFSNIESINNITKHGAVLVNETESQSQFTFDFTNKQGQSLVYNEVIRRVWENGQLVEEQYLFDQPLPTVKAPKKAKADAGDAPTAAKPAAKPAAKKAATPAAEKAVAETKAPAKKAAKTKSGK